MIKCEKCETEMIPAMLFGHATLANDSAKTDYFFVQYVNGTKEVKSLFGGIKEKENKCISKVNTMLCPKCGKVELYAEIENNEQ